MKKSNGTFIDLAESLQNYTSGWVAIDSRHRVVAYAKEFDAICKKVKNKKGIFLVPASKNYFGFITVGYKPRL